MLDNKLGTTIHVKFKYPIESIYYVITATNQEQNTNAINGCLRLIKGRIYYLPIDNDIIDSDEYNILKVFSDLAAKIEVKFVKEGFACVIPIIHNFQIKDKQQLCVIHN